MQEIGFLKFLVIATLFTASALATRSIEDDVVVGIDWCSKSVGAFRYGRVEVIEVTLDDELEAFAHEELSALILQRIKAVAEEYLSQQVNHAVVAVPYYYTDIQRLAIRDAGKLVGLNVERIMNEPYAVALAFGIDKERGEVEEFVLVIDLGRRTLDVTLLCIDSGVVEVLETNGGIRLGGEDFNERIETYLIKEFHRKHKKAIRSEKSALQKLRHEVERVKRELSFKEEVRVEIERLSDEISLNETLTRAHFEDLNMDLFQEILVSIDKVLNKYELKKREVDEILLVGGSARIPKVKQLVEDFFNGRAALQFPKPEETVVYGATIQASRLQGQEDYEEIQCFLDVHQLSIGIETAGGRVTKLINRFNIIPTISRSKDFTTMHDNQAAVSIQIFQGERPLAKDNLALGNLFLGNIPPAPRGVPQIKVTCEVDSVSNLFLRAEVMGTGNYAQINISLADRAPNDEEIERMVLQADEFADEDRILEEKIFVRHRLESLCNDLKLQLSYNKEEDFEGKSNQWKQLEVAISDTLSWLDENMEAESNEIEDKQKELEGFVISNMPSLNWVIRKKFKPALPLPITQDFLPFTVLKESPYFR